MEQNNTKEHLLSIIPRISNCFYLAKPTNLFWVLLVLLLVVALFEKKKQAEEEGEGEQHTEQHNKNDKRIKSMQRREIVQQSSMTAIFTSTNESKNYWKVVAEEE